MGQLAYIKSYTYTLGANENLNIDVSGNSFHIQSATGDLKVSVDDAPQFDGFEGLKYRSPDVFNRINIQDESGSSNTVRILISFGDVEDTSIKVAGAIAVSGGVTVKGGATATYGNVSLTNATATLIKAATTNRKSISVFNNEAIGGSTIYVGDDNSVTNSNGFPIPPQQGIVLDTDEAIYGYQNSGGATDARYWEDIN